jgi:hypothetical protein
MPAAIVWSESNGAGGNVRFGLRHPVLEGGAALAA